MLKQIENGKYYINQQGDARTVFCRILKMLERVFDDRIFEQRVGMKGDRTCIREMKRQKEIFNLEELAERS